jgi:hypothetical protein
MGRISAFAVNPITGFEFYTVFLPVDTEVPLLGSSLGMKLTTHLHHKMRRKKHGVFLTPLPVYTFMAGCLGLEDSVNF